MAQVAAVSLGEIKPKLKAKFLEMPRFKADFEIDVDTGLAPADEAVRKQIEKVGPKIFAKHVKERMAMIEKAIAGVDKDIDARFKKHFKETGIDPKAKALTPYQKKQHEDFLAKINDLVKRLQDYLQKIVDGINKSDSLKWIEEAFDKAYDAVKKALKGREIKRGFGGRAKVVILAVVAVVATAAVIVGTVMTGGALLAAIFVIAGASIAIIGALGKTVISLVKTRGKLQKSVAKLKEEAGTVKGYVDQCSKIPTKKQMDEAILKQAGLSVKDYQKFAGEDKINPDLVYKALAGKKRIFKQFDKHLKDVEAYATQMHMGIQAAKKEVSDLSMKSAQLSRDLSTAISKGLPDEAKKVLADAGKVQEQITLAEAGIGRSENQLKELSQLISDCRQINKDFDKLGVVKSKISGSMVKMSQVETFFGDLEGVGKTVNSVGGSLGKIQDNKNADWYAGIKNT